MENITIATWTTQVAESIGVTIFQHDISDDEDYDGDEEFYYTAELAIFLEPFDNEDVDQDPEGVKEKVLILATDLGGHNYHELIHHTIATVSLLYPNTYISPIIYVLSIDEDGGDNEVDVVDLSEEMYPEEAVVPKKQPLMKM
jgi:hypothetical protein